VTAVSLAAQVGIAAFVGVLIAREFGRGPETDGFFAAYGAFFVFALTGQAIRIVVLPPLALARQERRLAGELGGYALALAIVALPVIALLYLGADAIGGVLAGDDPVAEATAADALRWLIPAAVAQLFAALAASGLAALDDYTVAAAGYGAGTTAGLVLILVTYEEHGIVAVAWGMALGAVITLVVPAAALLVRAVAERVPASAARPAGAPVRERLGTFASGTAFQLGLQALYLVWLPAAAAVGTGAVTSFGYAYLAASGVVAVSAFSLGLVSAVPLARGGIGAAGAARHVVSASWLALALVAPAAAVLILVGGDLVSALLGSSYGGDVGSELGGLIAAFSPWMVVSVGLTVAFPLAFVVGRGNSLPVLAALGLVLQVPLVLAARELFGLGGLVAALTLSSAAVLAGLLHVLEALALVVPGFVRAVATVSVAALAAFLPAALVLPDEAAVVLGLAGYAVLATATRSLGLRDAWIYARELG
jgi:hypothetical protein